MTDDVEKLVVTLTVQSEDGNSTTVEAPIHILHRINLAVRHLLAAARFSREVGRIEKEHQGEALGGFWDSIFHHSTACILTTVASVEAYANEIFSDRNKLFPEYTPELIHELWETYEEKPILEKFELALLLLRKPALDRGARPYQDVAALIRLRNALTHFKPERISEAVEHTKISTKLADKIEGSPFFSEPEILFPRRWASHSCTSWAVNSAISFAMHFEGLAGLSAKYVTEDVADFDP